MKTTMMREPRHQYMTRTVTAATAVGSTTPRLLSLPEETGPIYIDCSELYPMMNNDCLTYILDILYRDDAGLQEKKNDTIRKLSQPRVKMTKDFFYTIAKKLGNDARLYRYLGYSEKNIAPFLEQNIGYLHKVYFRNTASRVQGSMDGLLRKDLIDKCLGTNHNNDGGNGYVILYMCDCVDKLNDYHRQKARMVLIYGAAMFPDYIDPDTLVLVDKNNKTGVLTLSEEERSKTRRMVRDVRRIKRIAPFFNSGSGDEDLEGLLSILREANDRFLPNMESRILRNDKIWKPLKKRLSHELGEITGLWMCSDIHRQRALSQGVRSWRDERFTPALVGITDPLKASILEKIVCINRQDPSSSENFEWMRVDEEVAAKWPLLLLPEGATRHAFFDFEYLADGTIYMIGVYSGSRYHCLWASSLSPEAEKNLLQEFCAYYRLLLNRDPDMRLWYWHAEKTHWRKQCMRHGLEEEAVDTQGWHDACDLMRTGTVVVHGALDFSLKSVLPAFHRHGRVPFEYAELDCEDGEASIDLALSYYKNNRSDKALCDSLEAYNRVDCEALYHIMSAIIDTLQSRSGVAAVAVAGTVVASGREEEVVEAAAVAGILALGAAGSLPPSCQTPDS